MVPNNPLILTERKREAEVGWYQTILSFSQSFVAYIENLCVYYINFIQFCWKLVFFEFLTQSRKAKSLSSLVLIYLAMRLFL